MECECGMPMRMVEVVDDTECWYCRACGMDAYTDAGFLDA